MGAIVARALLLALAASVACAQVPQQSQASALVVPREAPHHVVRPASDFKYAGAVVVVQCKLVYALMFIDKDGTIEPKHLVKDMSEAKLLTLLADANPDNVWMTETPCGSDQAT